MQTQVEAIISTYFLNIYFNYLKIVNPQGQVIEAENQILQEQFSEKGHSRVYTTKTFVCDEKVVEPTQVEQQYSHYFKGVTEAVSLALKGVTQFSYNKLYLGYVLIFPPLFLLVMVNLIVLFTSLALSMVGLTFMLVGVSLFVLNSLFSLKINKVPLTLWKAIRFIPAFTWRQVRFLLTSQRASRSFLATTHSQVLTMEEVIEEQS